MFFKKNVVKRKTKQRVMSVFMTLLMTLSLLPAGISGSGVLEVKAADAIDNGAAYETGDFAGWSWNVFGAGTDMKYASITASTDGSGAVNMNVTSDKGKISSSQDGISFLNKKLANTTDDFILQATIKIKDCGSSSSNQKQVGFGLMMNPVVSTVSTDQSPMTHVYVGFENAVWGISQRVEGTRTVTALSTDGLNPPEIGQSYELTLQKVGNEVIGSINGVMSTVTIGENDFEDGLYVGMFVARYCDIDFSNVRLTTKTTEQNTTLVDQTNPVKTQYCVGNTIADIDLTGFSAKVMIGDEEKTISGADCIIKEFDTSTEGKANIVLNYLGLDINVPVALIKEAVTDIAMTYAPTKTDYFVGDELDWTGFEATVSYNSGVTKDVKALIEAGDAETVVSGFDSSVAGTKTVVVTHTHGGESASVSFDVTVSDAALESISLTGPNQTTFYKDVPIADGAYKSGLKVTANFADGTKEVITDSSKFTVSPEANVDNTTLGTTTYTVTYTVGDVTKTATYELAVIDASIIGAAINTYPTTTTFAQGTEFSSEGLVVETLSDSGVKTVLTSDQYEVDASAFNKDVIGSYTITITEKVSGEDYTCSYVATVAEKTEFTYEDLEWNDTVFGQSIDKTNRPTVTDGVITVEQGEGKGKVTDAGQDGISYYYTSVGADKNFVFSATVTVDYFVTKSAPDNQEGFGLMVRDSLGPDGDSSIYYSSAASVGGYYGRYNVFGRYGITEEDTANFTNFYEYVKTNAVTSYYNNDVNHYVISEPKTFKMTIAKDNTGIWATMYDEEGNDVLALSNNGSAGDWGINVIENDDGAPNRVYMPTDAFTSIDSDSIYLGFMAARGAKISIDTESISLTVTSAASDAPQKVLESGPVEPQISITSLKTTAESAYDLGVNVNTPGLLTVKVNGSVIEKQMDVTSAGTVTIPTELVLGNNTVQLTFEPDASQNITSAATLTSNNTIVFRQYGTEEKNAIYASPNGTSTAEGTLEDPLDLVTAINFCRAGQTVYMLEGTYNYAGIEIPHGNNGTETERKNLEAYSGNTGDVTIDLQGSSTDTFAVSGNYWNVKGINVTNGGGIRIGGNYNVIELCKAYNNYETGIQISRTDTAATIDLWPSYNTILNCDSFNNRDSSDNNADGFAAKLTCGVGNVFQGCISYYNADDGWDLFAKAQTIGAVTLIDCISYANGFYQKADGTLEETAGDGNGFKLGGSGVAIAHEAYNCIAFGNKTNGFTNNSNPLFNAYNCVSYNNGGQNLELHNYTGVSEEGLRVNGFVSFRDDTVSSFDLLTVSLSSDISSVSDKTVIYSAENYLYDKNTKQSSNLDGVVLTESNFANLSDFAAYCNLTLTYERDEDGNIIFGDFLRFIAPVPEDPTTETPEDPTTETPDDPSPETPQDPSNETPQNPSTETPQNPSTGNNSGTTTTSSGNSNQNAGNSSASGSTAAVENTGAVNTGDNAPIANAIVLLFAGIIVLAAFARKKRA